MKRNWNRIVLLCLIYIIGAIGAFAQQITETNLLFEKEVERFNDTDNCSVRAIATMFDLPYSVAYYSLENFGRKKNAVNLKMFGMSHADLNRQTRRFNLQIDTYVYPKQVPYEIFYRDIKNDYMLYNYYVILEDHIYTLKGETNGYRLYGNYNEKSRKVLGYVRIYKK
jgi:hypothetical protein